MPASVSNQSGTVILTRSRKAVRKKPVYFVLVYTLVFAGGCELAGRTDMLFLSLAVTAVTGAAVAITATLSANCVLGGCTDSAARRRDTVHAAVTGGVYGAVTAWLVQLLIRIAV